jgi:hypothetical protein
MRMQIKRDMENSKRELLEKFEKVKQGKVTPINIFLI